jgi:hypothetical protein
MTAVAARSGEIGASPYLLRLSVDGLIVVASVCLVELSGRIETIDRNPPTPPSAANKPRAATPALPTDAPPTQSTATPIVEPATAAASSDEAKLAGPEPRAERRAAHRDLPPTATEGEAAPAEPPNQTGDITEDGDTTAPEIAATPLAVDPPAERKTPAERGSDIPADPLGGPADPPPQEGADHDVVPTETLPPSPTGSGATRTCIPAASATAALLCLAAALTGLLPGTVGWAAVAAVAVSRARLTGVRKPLPFGPFLVAATIITGLVAS